MSKTPVARARRAAAEAVAATAWEQWGVLGFHTDGLGDVRGSYLIDPEALLVLTLDAVRHEPRLDQALSWWAARGSARISLPRVDYVLRLVDADLTSEVGAFGARLWGAKNASGSWIRRAREAGLEATDPPERVKGRVIPMHNWPATALLKTRAIAGVGARADLIAYLAARGPRPSTLTQMEKALGYSRSSLRSGCEDLAHVGVATLGIDGPIHYTFRPGVIDLGDVAPWRFWPQIVAFLIGAARWGDGLADPTPFLLGVEARALYETLVAFHGEHPLPAAYPVADPREHPGPAYAEPFAETVESVARWLAAGLPV